jgi:hypothetical protein
VEIDLFKHCPLEKSGRPEGAMVMKPDDIQFESHPPANESRLQGSLELCRPNRHTQAEAARKKAVMKTSAASCPMTGSYRLVDQPYVAAKFIFQAKR